MSLSLTGFSPQEETCKQQSYLQFHKHVTSFEWVCLLLNRGEGEKSNYQITQLKHAALLQRPKSTEKWKLV